jgi:hypothetical protein
MRTALKAFSEIAGEAVQYDEVYEHWYAINDFLQKRL